MTDELTDTFHALMEATFEIAPEAPDLSTSTPRSPRRHPLVAVASGFAAVIVVIGLAFSLARLAADDRDRTIGSATDPTPTSVQSADPTLGSELADPPSLETLAADLAYPSQWSPTGEIDLVDGAWEGEPVDGGLTVTRAILFALDTGTLNDDNVDDATVVLAIDPGGSGTFFDLYVVDGATLTVAGPAVLGDRIEDLDLAITAGEVTAGYADRDGQTSARRYDLVEGVLGRLDAPFPLLGPYLDSECRVAAESDATIEYLDHTATLVACNEIQGEEFIASYGGTVIDVINGYLLISIPDEESGNPATVFEVTVPGGSTWLVDGTCSVEGDVLSARGSSTNPDGDVVVTVELTATITTQTGTVVFGDLASSYSGTITSLEITSDRFVAFADIGGGEALTVAGRCQFSTPDS